MAKGPRKDPPRNNPDANPNYQGGGEKSNYRHVFIDRGFKEDFVHDLVNGIAAIQEKGNPHQKKQFIWTVVAAIAGIVAALGGITAAGFVGWQSLLTRQSLRDTREFFQRDQRPYVYSNFVGPVLPGADHRVFTELYYANNGKSPAVRFIKDGAVMPGEDWGVCTKKANWWFAQLGNKPLESHSSVPLYSILMQGEKPVTTPISSLYPMDTLPVVYVVVARLQYSDLFGKLYWTDVCWLHVSQNQAETIRCPNHNEIH